jgi:chemotaxis methyl-accepting protein methylase
MHVGRMNSKILRRCLEIYLCLNRRIWVRLPASLRLRFLGRAYGRHLHALVCLHAERKQYHSTFFLRNRPELQVMCRLLDQKAPDSSLDISVLACSKGAEVYSMLWAIRSARPDLKVNTNALDISREIVEFAARGVYSRNSADVQKAGKHECITEIGDVTWRDQPWSIFECLTDREMEAMFEVKGDQVMVRPWLKQGITWHTADAGDPELVRIIGPQDMVMANRFLCHMEPSAAEKCLRNIARLVKPGGYLFVSGIDLDVRTKVARSLGWKPVPELMREVHEGDVSLKNGWPLEWWGLEPFCEDLPDWRIRYASIFQIGEVCPDTGVLVET